MVKLTNCNPRVNPSFLFEAMTHDDTANWGWGRNLFMGFLLTLITGSYAQNNWIILDSPSTKNLNKLYFLNNQTGWVAGDSGLIMKTSNGGGDWLTQQTNIDNNIEEIFMRNEDYGWALGIQLPTAERNDYGTLILRTSDGGLTWDNYLYPNEYFLTIIFLDSLSGWMGGESGRLMGTTDGGVSWFQANVDSNIFSGFAIRKFRFLTEQYGYAVGGYMDLAGVIWRTDNGGQFWTVQGVAPEPILDLHFIDSTNILAVGGDLDFGSGKVTSRDGGISWQYTYLGVFGEANAIAFRTPAEAWSALGFTGTSMFTYDSGETWMDFYNPDTTPMYDVTFTDSVTGFMAGDNGKILKYNPITGIVESGDSRKPEEPILFQNYPNPFNTTTTFGYELTFSAIVSLQIFDIKGAMIANLENGVRNPGYHKIAFNAVDLSSGVYLCRLTMISPDGRNQSSKVSKMILLK